MNRQTDQRILKIFLPGFRIQSEILTGFRIPQLKRIADSSIFCARILDFACNLNIYFCPNFGFWAKMEGRFWLINHNVSADLHTPIEPLLLGIQLQVSSRTFDKVSDME